MQAICCPSCPFTQHTASNNMPSTTSSQTCYPACCSRRHANRLAAEQIVLPIMPLNTTYCPVNSRTVEPKISVKNATQLAAQHKQLHIIRPAQHKILPNTICCAACYPVGRQTQNAAHTTHLNMLPLKHATQHTAQHDMLCNMLPNSPLKNYILLNMLPKKSLNTTCYMTQHTAQDDALCNMLHWPSNTSSCRLCCST